MRILIINHYSGSLSLGMEYRHVYMAKEFRKLGHEVCIVASAYSHLRTEQPNLNAVGVKINSHDDLDHIWLDGCNYTGNGIRRMINMLGFSFSLWWHAKEIAGLWKPDVVYTSSPHPLQSYGAVKLAKFTNAKFIFEIRDLWPLTLIELAGFSPLHPVIRLFDHAERYGCIHADTVVSLLPVVAEYMTSLRDVSLDKLCIIPNGISLDDWPEDPPPITGDLADHIKAISAQGYLLVGYAGSHGQSDALYTLLEAAALLKDKPIRFVLIGDGNEKGRLLQHVQKNDLYNVKMFPPIPKSTIPDFLKAIDITFIGWHRNPLYRFGISPNKLMDYMMAGKPIVHAVEAGNDPVAEAKCGLTIAPENPAAIREAILTLAAMSSSEREAMGENGRQFILAEQTYPVLAKRFMDAVGGA